ncbi:MAG TPA: hypothetical protein VEW08_02480 [Steroidobacteraceae bacterium]|nr:hypothetical protein [Steroidobacteraceae bacterium]
MKHRVGLGLTLAVCAAVEAAEPSSSPVPTASVPAAAPAASPTPAPATPVPVPTSKPLPAKPLDLRVGDVRKYMMPNEYRAVLDAPHAEKNTVVVEGKRELLPVEYEEPIPVGPLMPLWWGLKNPSQSWRIFLPDLNRTERPREPEDKVPPPIFRWGP